MSYLKKLGLYGIRSYGDKNSEEYEQIVFFKPLTLILGNNGAGKSTIIEALKVITTGSFPPNSDKGKTFIKDPRLLGTFESQGSISLIFKAINQKQILVRRLFQVKKDKNDKMTFDSKDATIKVRDKNTGKDISVDHKCLEIEKQIPQLLGVSKAVFENVIFCHQDESLWPFGDSSTLKNIFDELFDTKQFTKLQESLQKQQKEIKKELTETKIHLQHFKSRYDEAVSFKQSIAKEAEDLYEETIQLEKNREEYRNLIQNEENEEAVRIRIDDLNKEIHICTYRKEMSVKNQKQILDSCTHHYFIDQDIDSMKTLQEQVKEENRKLKQQKDQLEEIIENEKRDLEKLKLEIEQIGFSDKNLKQINQELKVLKQKLNEIMMKDLDSDKIVLEEAKIFKENNETQYRATFGVLKSQMNSLQNELLQCEQQVQKNQVKQATLKESSAHSQKRINQLSEDIKKIQNSQTKNELSDTLSNLEASKNNCEQFSLQIKQLTDDISQIKSENVDLQRQIGIINQQSSLKSIQLEFQSIQKQIEEINKTMAIHQKEYEKFNLPQNILLGEQKNKCNIELKEMKIQQQKIDQEISKLNGRLEHLEDQDIIYDQKLNQITQTFRESNLLSIITNSENDADFETKYRSIKEEIEALNNNISEKETCLMIDKQVLAYCQSKNKCKFCKHDIKADDLTKIAKSQEDRTKRAEKDLQQYREQKIQKNFEKKTLKKLKEQYEQYNDVKQKNKKNSKEIKDLELQIKESQDKQSEIQQQIFQKQERYSIFEQATSVQNEILKSQRQLHEQEKRRLKFQNENPQLLDIDNLNIISSDQAEQIHNQYKQNNQKLEFLSNQLIKENNKKSNYGARIQHFESQKENLQKKILEEKQTVERNQQEIKDNEKQIGVQTNEIQNIDIETQKQNKQVSEFKKNLEETNKQFQTSQQNYDQTKILIGEYLPKFEKVFNQYEEIKQAKGKQKQKIQENQLSQLQDKFNAKEKSKNQNEIQLKDIIEQISEQTGELDNLIKGIQYLELGQSLIQIENDLTNKSQTLKEQIKILERVQIQSKSNNEKLQKIKAYEETCKYRKQALEKNYIEAIAKYDQSEEKYCRTQVEQEIKNGLQQDISVYLEELDKTLINYHKEKMQQINKCIADTWRKVYQGNDIKKVEIKAEEAEGRGKKIYSYRIVMYVLNENDNTLKEIDMKGRCSAGQKVLASILIRLALAEAFTINCGILALDEPTTNLDKLHAQKLGEQLCELIESRKGQDSFQLIIISHDKDFIQLMQQRTQTNDFYQIYKQNGCSKIERRTYKNALMNKQID